MLSSVVKFLFLNNSKKMFKIRNLINKKKHLLHVFRCLIYEYSSFSGSKEYSNEFIISTALEIIEMRKNFSVKSELEWIFMFRRNRIDICKIILVFLQLLGFEELGRPEEFIKKIPVVEMIKCSRTTLLCLYVHIRSD